MIIMHPWFKQLEIDGSYRFAFFRQHISEHHVDIWNASDTTRKEQRCSGMCSKPTHRWHRQKRNGSDVDSCQDGWRCRWTVRAVEGTQKLVCAQKWHLSLRPFTSETFCSAFYQKLVLLFRSIPEEIDPPLQKYLGQGLKKSVIKG